VKLLVSGDQLAFKEIYDRYSQSLYWYVCNRIRSKEESEEILQELFLWLWKKHETLGHITELKPYLFSAARYKIVNYIDKSVVRDRYAEHYALYESTHDTSTEAYANLSDFDNILERSIANLPDNCQTAFRLSRIEQMPIAHIAERMNLSTGTVENYIGQALNHLRMVWGDHYKG